jgi:hypothetical protein
MNATMPVDEITPTLVAAEQDVLDEQIRLLEEGIELNTAQVAKLYEVRQSALRRIILFGLLLCASGWVLFQTYSFAGPMLSTDLTAPGSPTFFDHLEALSSLLAFLATLSVCCGLLLLAFVTAVGHAFTSWGLLTRQEGTIARAKATLKDVLEASADE